MPSLAAASSRRLLVASNQARRQWFQRCNYTRPSTKITPPYPGHTLDVVTPPTPDPPVEAPPEPMAYVRKPVTSAHAIDTTTRKLSARDSVAVTGAGSVVHGDYGDLGLDVAQGIPLEYLTQLRPAAEGAACLRVISEKAPDAKGTLLVYGASQPNAMATVQLASTAGHAVVAVVGGEHSGNSEMVDVVKGLAAEPGTAVGEEYAIVKKNFADLVDATIHGDPGSLSFDPDVFLSDFKTNLLDYVAKYPATLPAAVDESHLDFNYGEKHRANFRDNMDTYLSQFLAGAFPMDPAKLDSYFDGKQYAAFKAKFGKQTTAVISGDEPGDFNPPNVVQEMLKSSETPNDPIVPYEFSCLQESVTDVEPKKGGPLLGAVIAVTPTLVEAAEAVEKAGPSKRAKAEALCFLTKAQRQAFSAAMSVANVAKQHGAPVYAVGGKLPGVKTVEPSDEDVQEALAGMEIDESGNSRINYFLQVYRAGDFPIYADYAVHRATEELAGPRQIVVTK